MRPERLEPSILLSSRSVDTEVAADVRGRDRESRGSWKVPILFEDDHLLALDKPSGLLTALEPNAPQSPSLLNLLHAGIAQGKPWATDRNLGYLRNAHRLDLETSGVLLLAKNKTALIALANLFGSEQPIEKYVVLVRGVPNQDQFNLQARLAPHPVRRGRVRVDPQRGRRSQTRVRVLERFSGYALLECRPLTRRPHQIRVHLRYAGLPVVGDRLYGGAPLFLSRIKPGYRAKADEPERPLMGRTALHVDQLALAHPASRQSLVITASWPKDLTVALKYLRRFAPLKSEV